MIIVDVTVSADPTDDHRDATETSRNSGHLPPWEGEQGNDDELSPLDTSTPVLNPGGVGKLLANAFVYLHSEEQCSRFSRRPQGAW